MMYKAKVAVCSDIQNTQHKASAMYNFLNNKSGGT